MIDDHAAYYDTDDEEFMNGEQSGADGDDGGRVLINDDVNLATVGTPLPPLLRNLVLVWVVWQRDWW